MQISIYAHILASDEKCDKYIAPVLMCMIASVTMCDDLIVSIISSLKAEEPKTITGIRHLLYYKYHVESNLSVNLFHCFSFNEALYCICRS